MDGYCLRTRLLETPSVCLYYKGMEDDNTVPFALNVIVSFIPSDSLALDEIAAKGLCKRLNEDKEVLLSHGYTEFDIIKITNSI